MDHRGQGMDRVMALGDGHHPACAWHDQWEDGRWDGVLPFLGPDGARVGESVREARDPVLTPYGGLLCLLLGSAVLGRPGTPSQSCPSSAPWTWWCHQ